MILGPITKSVFTALMMGVSAVEWGVSKELMTKKFRSIDNSLRQRLLILLLNILFTFFLLGIIHTMWFGDDWVRALLAH